MERDCKQDIKDILLKVLIMGMLVLLLFGVASTKEDEISVVFEKISPKKRQKDSQFPSSAATETSL